MCVEGGGQTPTPRPQQHRPASQGSFANPFSGLACLGHVEVEGLVTWVLSLSLSPLSLSRTQTPTESLKCETWGVLSVPRRAGLGGGEEEGLGWKIDEALAGS